MLLDVVERSLPSSLLSIKKKIKLNKIQNFHHMYITKYPKYFQPAQKKKRKYQPSSQTSLFPRP